MMTRREWSEPEPTYMSDKEKVSFLRDLRQKPARPSGSRPLPPSKFTPFTQRMDETQRVPALERVQPTLNKRNSLPAMPQRRSSPTRSDSRRSSQRPFAGRPLARAPAASDEENEGCQTLDKRASHRAPSVYVENGTRWMEKQEVKSLRQALEDMDLKEERRVHDAAQKEAAELVWRHQNPNAPYANLEPSRDYRSHLRKGSYQRSIADAASTLSGRRSASGSSQASSASTTSSNSHIECKPTVQAPLRRVSPPSGTVSVQKRRSVPGLTSYDGLAEAVANDIASAHRRSISGSKRILSGEKKPLFVNPNDRIWEDPQEDQTPPRKQQVMEGQPAVSTAAAPSYVRKNPFARVRMQQDKPERSNSMPILSPSPSRLDRVEIQRNPPSRSRNAGYTSNEHVAPPIVHEQETHAGDAESNGSPTKAGAEIRGEDIRAATSKLRKEYSAKLPRPTMVSDRPGRPIVSFEKSWRPREVVMEEQHAFAAANPQEHSVPRKTTNELMNSAQRQGSHVRANSVPIPVINLPDGAEIPSIVLPEEPGSTASVMQSASATPAINIEAPSINVSAPEPDRPMHEGRSQQPPSARPLPHHAASSPLPKLKSSLHMTPSIRQSGALCAHCALPIAGRVLSAAGQRFHPGCFVCHQCSTNLEHVAFYPEPEQQRAARAERAHAGDGDGDYYDGGDAATPRFYCHLDFHELFSPRCKSCKTPIEGEVVVACGAEWHVGHFFCAQCGDPFEPSTPFVERDGYAWCVGCHTHRTSPRCRACRKPVLDDVVVKALGADWHGACFVCTECHGDFGDGRYFLRGDSQDPVCVRCEERRLKAY